MFAVLSKIENGTNQEMIFRLGHSGCQIVVIKYNYGMSRSCINILGPWRPGHMLLLFIPAAR